MSQFWKFEVDKRTKFLGKAKQNRAKRQEVSKKPLKIIIIQKNIRSFLMSRRYGGDQYPLLLRKTQQIYKNKDYIQQLWQTLDQKPSILQKKVTNLTFECLLSGLKLEINIISLIRMMAIVSRDPNVLAVRHYSFALQNFLLLILEINDLQLLFKSDKFIEAIGFMINQNACILIDIIYKLKSQQLIEKLINMFAKSKRKNCIKLGLSKSLEQLNISYRKIYELFMNAIKLNKEDSLTILLSILIQILKNKYIKLIQEKYMVDQTFFKAPQFKEEVQQFLLEKPQWKEYQQNLIPLTNLLSFFLGKIHKISDNSLENIVFIVSEITKLSQAFSTLKLNTNQFFILIEKLQSKSFLFNKEEQIMKYQELFFAVIILEKYMESINDIQFLNQFRFDTERLSVSIKTYIIKFMKNICTFSSEISILQQIIEHSVVFMSNLYNKIFRTNLLKTSVFEDPSLAVFTQNLKIKNNITVYNQLKKIIQRSPYLLPLKTRFLMFKQMLIKKANYHNYQVYNLTIRRGHQFQDAFKQLFRKNLRNRLHITFINEYGMLQAGSDAGGLTKQFLTRIFKVAFNPKFGLFIENSKKQLMPNPLFYNIRNSQQKAHQYQFIGQLLGKSLYENIMLGVKFAGPFLNLLINKKNTVDDLMSIDPDLYRSLVFIMGMEQGVSDLELSFQYQDSINKRIIDLVPQGSKKKVTDSNKMEYLNLLINYKVNHSFKRQVKYIRKGFRQIINQTSIQIFNYAQLNYLISGCGTIDVYDWKNHTIYSGNTDPQYIQNFWSVVSQFSEDQKSLLLKFVTSCERPSFLGFKDLEPRFCIRILQKKQDLPISHTCANVLDLPLYPDKQTLKNKLLYAIKAQAGFEFA